MQKKMKTAPFRYLLGPAPEIQLNQKERPPNHVLQATLLDCQQV